MSYQVGALARKVIALGEQQEPADRRVSGVVGVTYVETLNDGRILANLEDGSQWILPDRDDARFDIGDVYQALRRREHLQK